MRFAMSLSTIDQAESAAAEPQQATPIQQLAERSEFGELLARRFCGTCIDYILLFLFLVLAEAGLGKELYQATVWVWVGILPLYFLVTEGLWGRSVGKLIMGTVVVDKAGRPPGIIKAAARTVLRIVEVNPFLICLPAIIAYTASKRRQRLGDMFARTYVLRAADLKALKNGLPPALPGQAANPVEILAQRSHPLSLLVRRAIGAQIDILVLIMLIAVPALAFGKKLDPIFDWVALAWLAAVVAYFLALEALFGRTLGKLVTGTIVVDRNGRAPSLAKTLVRTLLRLVEVNPLLIGGVPAGIALLSTRRHQRIGDVLADTYVVRKKDLNRNAAVLQQRGL
jgi:uncharacterized RDD family membrane protein YckC